MTPRFFPYRPTRLRVVMAGLAVTGVVTNDIIGPALLGGLA